MRKVRKILGAIIRSVVVLVLILSSTGLIAQAAPADNLDSQINRAIERANNQSGAPAGQEGDSSAGTGGRSGNLSSDSSTSTDSGARRDDPTVLDVQAGNDADGNAHECSLDVGPAEEPGMALDSLPARPPDAPEG